jgi:hypothetical protein
MELTKICPVDEALRDYQPEVKALVLPWINMNAGLVIMCKHGWLLGECPMGQKYICQFSLNPEKRYAISDPRFWIGRDVTVNDT